jgi:hypothetical protein
MNFEEYAALGRKIKLAKPQYREFSDEEVGVVYVQKHGLPNINSNAWFFLDERIERARKQSEFAHLQFEKALDDAIRPLEWAGRLEQQAIEAETTHIRARQQLEQQRLEFELTKRAYELGVDLQTYKTLQVEQAQMRLRVTEARHLADVEVSKQRQLKRMDFIVEVLKNREDLRHLSKAAALDRLLNESKNRAVDSGKKAQGHLPRPDSEADDE